MRARTGATPARLALAARAKVLRERGFTFEQIAVDLEISRTYASALVDDPDGSLARARKDSYHGVCIDCGGPTDGGNGRAQAPERCADCRHIFEHDSRIWTPETVIDAIQRFAAIHGRPPIADEWITSDPEHGYPPRSAVYDSNNGRKDWAFSKWADAIEAAGFPRPNTGRRTMTQARGGYTVLHETEPGVWKEAGQYSVTAQILALNKALDGAEPVGRWVAIPGRYWAPRVLQPKTIYEFVSE